MQRNRSPVLSLMIPKCSTPCVCEEARKADDAVRARDLHRAGALSQQHCCYLEDVRDPQEGPDAEESLEGDRKQVLDRKKGKTRGRKKR